jgi:hypothetical protein
MDTVRANRTEDNPLQPISYAGVLYAVIEAVSLYLIYVRVQILDRSEDSSQGKYGGGRNIEW